MSNISSDSNYYDAIVAPHPLQYVVLCAKKEKGCLLPISVLRGVTMGSAHAYSNRVFVHLREQKKGDREKER